MPVRSQLTRSSSRRSGSGGGGGGSGNTSPVTQLASVNLASPTLTAFPSGTLFEGALAYVSTLKAYFELVQDTLPTTTTTVIAASGKPGYQWQRVAISTPHWQAQTTWTIDPKNSTGLANDENSGLNSGAPLLTYAEHAARLSNAVIAQSVVVTVLGDQQVADVATYNYWVSNNATVTFNGVPAVVFTSTVTSFTLQTVNNTAAATDDSQFVDNAVPGGSWTAAGALNKGVIIQRTNGTLIYCFPLKDLGTNTLRVGIPLNPTNYLLNPVFSPGDTYQLLQMPELLNVNFVNPSYLGTIFNLFDVRIPTFPHYPTRKFKNSYFSTFFSGPGEIYQGCCFDTGAISLGVGNLGLMTFTGCSFKGTGTTLYSFENVPSSNFEGQVTTFQGCGLLVENGNVNCSQFNAYDFTSGTHAVLRANTNARIHMLGVLSGKGNTSGLFEATGGSLIYSSGQMADTFVYKLASTTNATPLKAGTVTSATQIPLTGGGNGVFQFDTP